MSTAAAVDHYLETQRAVLDATGAEVTSRTVAMPEPFGVAHVLEAGTGTPLLFLHGSGVVDQWAPLIPLLAPHFRLLMPHKPGTGLALPFDYRGVNLRRHGTAFIEGLLDGLGLESAVICGNSMGGYFAFSFALAHPERVSTLVLLGEPAGTNPGNARGTNLFHRLVGTRGLNALLYKTALRPRPGAAGARAGLARGRLIAQPQAAPDALMECLAAGWQLPGAVRSWYTMVEQAFDPPGRGITQKATILTNALAPELGRLPTSTLFVWGEHDPLTPVSVGRALAEKMPSARFELVRDASHLVHIDQPAVCADAIRRFLS